MVHMAHTGSPVAPIGRMGHNGNDGHALSKDSPLAAGQGVRALNSPAPISATGTYRVKVTT
jgi:hypothetical protein